jgi:putative hydrolase of the HAD superfamily
MSSHDSSPSSIRAVLFDFGLVLSASEDPTAWKRMKDFLGAEETAFHPAYWSRRLDYDRGTLTGADFWRQIALEFGMQLDGLQLQQLMAEDIALWGRPNQDMIDWAAALQRAGIKTGVLSNMGDAMETGLRALCPWIDNFHHCTFSHRLLTVKPDPAIYHHAVEGLGMPAEEILFVDDRAENVAGAEAIGMQAIQYTDHASFVSTMRARGLGWLLDVGKI